jgi:Zn-dependent protease with chaperone function
MLNTTFYYLLMFAVVGVPFYFQHRAKGISESITVEDGIGKLNGITARLTIFIIACLYVMSFIGISLRNTAMQEVGFFACLFSFLFLHTQHSLIINRIRREPIKPEDRLRAAVRKFAVVIVVMTIYFGLDELLVPQLGTIPAVIISISVLIYCVPLLVRIGLDANTMHPSELKNTILNTFDRAQTPVGEIYLIDHKRFNGANAFVCGPKYGFGPFRRSLFVTKSLFETLEPDEIQAVVCHEAAHFQKNHLFMRGFYSVLGLILGASLVSFPLLFVASLLKLPTVWFQLAIMIATGSTVMAQLWFLFQVIRKQEFEADLEALKIGASASALISALEKLTIKNGSSRKRESAFQRFIFFNAHPSVEERVIAIKDRKIPEDTRFFPSWQVSVSYASFIILSASLALVYQKGGKSNETAQRSIASESKNTPKTSTGQNLPTEKNPVKPDTGGTDE